MSSSCHTEQKTFIEVSGTNNTESREKKSTAAIFEDF